MVNQTRAQRAPKERLYAIVRGKEKGEKNPGEKYFGMVQTTNSQKREKGDRGREMQVLAFGGYRRMGGTMRSEVRHRQRERAAGRRNGGGLREKRPWTLQKVKFHC